MATVLKVDLHWLITGKPSPTEKRLRSHWRSFDMKYTRLILETLLKERDAAAEELAQAKERRDNGEAGAEKDVDYYEMVLRGVEVNLRVLAHDAPSVREHVHSALDEPTPEK